MGSSVYVLALAIRLVFLTQGVDNPMMRVPMVDEYFNWEVAKVILNEGLRPISYVRSPGYPYLLAGLAYLLNSESFLVRLVQVFFDALSPVLMFLIGLRLFGLAAGYLAGLLGAVFWASVFFSSQLLDTSLTVLLALTATYLLVRLPNERWWKWLACGAVVGLTAVVRPNFLAVPPVLAGVLVVAGWIKRSRQDEPSSGRAMLREPRMQGFVRAGLLVLGAVVAVAPVTLRNRIVAGEWTIVSVGGGANLWIANRPGADGKEVGMAVNKDIDLPPVPAHADPWEECLAYRVATQYAQQKLGHNARLGQIDHLFYGMMFDHVMHHPSEFFTNVFKRVCWTFNAHEFPNNKDLYEFCDYSPLLRALSYLHWGILAPPALVGVGLAIARPGTFGVVLSCYLAFVATLVLTGALFVINARYRLPVSTLLLPFAAHTVISLYHSARHPRLHAPRLAIAMPALIALAVVCNVNLFGFRPAKKPAYLSWFHALACRFCADPDLLDASMDRLGPKMVADAEASEGRGSMADLIRRYHRPFAFLMRHYYRRGDLDLARQYGDLMLRHEAYDEGRVRTYFALAVRSGHHEHARNVVEAITPVLGKQNPALLARFWMWVGARYRDRDALGIAERLFDGLSRQHPDNKDYRRTLDDIRRLLKALTTTSASQAAQTSRPLSKDRP